MQSGGEVTHMHSPAESLTAVFSIRADTVVVSFARTLSARRGLDRAYIPDRAQLTASGVAPGANRL